MILENLLWKAALSPSLARAQQLHEEVYRQKVLLQNFVIVFDGNGNPSRHRTGSTIATELYTVTSIVHEELTNLRDYLQEGKAAALQDFLRILGDGRKDKKTDNPFQDSFRAYEDLYQEMAEKYENGAREIIGTPLQDMVLDLLVKRKSPFTQKCELFSYEQIGESVLQEFRDFATQTRQVYDFDIESFMQGYRSLLLELRNQIASSSRHLELRIETTRPLPSLRSFKPSPTKSPANPDQIRQEEADVQRIELKRKIAAQPGWENLDALIANHYQSIRSLEKTEILTIGQNPMSGQIFLMPKTRRKAVAFDELIGYESQKEQLLRNTKRLMQGKDANSVFLYGPPGTGKSSMVNALLTTYAKQGLRIIDINKNAAQFLPQVFDEVDQNHEYKFIILIDEFDIGKDKALYDSLKTVMEGSFDGLPKNARLYVISNYTNAMRPGFVQKDDAGGDVEYRALEDRFGLVIHFPLPDQEQQQRILAHYAATIGSEETKEKDQSLLWDGFKAYCQFRKIKDANPRNIRDYIKTRS